MPSEVEVWVQDETQVREFLKGFRHLHQFGNRELLQPTHDGVSRLLAIISDREAKLAAAEAKWRATQDRFIEQNRVLDEWRPDGYPPKDARGSAAIARWIIESLERELTDRAEAAERQLAAVAKHLEACGECYSCFLECETELHAELGHVANAALGASPPVAPEGD
jgi:NAD-dependent dihydropyrimidine dehydrogenase PreA subunit